MAQIHWTHQGHVQLWEGWFERGGANKLTIEAEHSGIKNGVDLYQVQKLFALIMKSENVLANLHFANRCTQTHRHTDSDAQTHRRTDSDAQMHRLRCTDTQTHNSDAQTHRHKRCTESDAHRHTDARTQIQSHCIALLCMHIQGYNCSLCNACSMIQGGLIRLLRKLSYPTYLVEMVQSSY